jgi:hypothetical protein
MKNKIILLVIIFSAFQLFAQQLAIPFRDGKKWGVSDVNGNLIIPAAYDAATFDEHSSYNQEIIFTQLKGKKGLIVKGVEVFKPEYLSIVFTQNIYIATKEVNNQYELHIADQTGKEVLDHSFVLLTSLKEHSFYTKVQSEKGSERSKVNYLVTLSLINRDNKKSVMVWDVQQSKITQWLFKDYYSISDPSYYDDFPLHFRYKINADSPIQEKSFFVNEGQLAVAPPDDKRVLSEILIPKEERSGSSRSSGTGNGSGSGKGGRGSGSGGISERYSEREEIRSDYDVVVESPTIKGDPDSDASLVAPNEVPVKEKPKEYVPKTAEYSLLNSKIIFETSLRNNPKVKGASEVHLNRKISDLKLNKIGYVEVKSTKADTIFYYKNFITYRNGSKYGVLIGDDSSRAREFDSLIVKQYTSHLEFKGKLSFLVGNKDKKTKKFKWSIMDSDLEMKFPFDYDQIIDNNPYGGEDLNQWTAIVDGKYGIINPNGTVLLAPEYDEIVSKKNSFGRNVFLQMRKGNLYGVYIRERDKKIEIYPALYPYPIDKIYFNYPFQKDGFSELTKEQKEQSIMLFSLTNEQGKPMGYANKNGTFYFKN